MTNEQQTFLKGEAPSWDERNSDRVKEIKRNYARRNITRSRAWNKEWVKNNMEKRLLAQAKRTALIRGFTFNLILEDVIIPEVCPLLGVKFDFEIYQGNIPNRPSIDRIDSTNGYVKGNIQVISSLANRMKNNASPEELIIFAENVLKIYKDKKIDNRNNQGNSTSK